MECTSHYDPENVLYTVNATLNLTNQHPLVLEALLAHEFLVDPIYVAVELTPYNINSLFLTLFPQV